jgi:hypothetical protein
MEFYIRMLSQNGKFAYCDKPLVDITNGMPSQLTAKCLADNALLVRENIYLYKKITNNRAFNFQLFNHLAFLFCGYRIRYTQDLIRCGVSEPVPSVLKLVIAYSWILRVYRFVVRGTRWITKRLGGF